MAFVDLRQETRNNFGTPNDQPITKLDQINTGCLLRIADAVEKMAVNHNKLINERDYYIKLFNERTKTVLELRKQISALRGVITKLKNKST